MIKVLYALHPKSVPQAWYRSGDTNMATRMLKHLSPNIVVDVLSDFSYYTKERSDELLELLDTFDIAGAVNSAPHIVKRTFLKETMNYIRSIAHEYDVIHFHNSNVASIHWMTEYFKDIDVPLIYTMHTPPENSSFQFYHKDEYIDFVKQPKNHLVAVSHSHKERVLRALNIQEEDAPQLIAIPNGIEYEYHKENVQDIDVIVVGRLDPTKDILHSLKSARACSPEGRIVYVGDTTSTSVNNENYRSEVLSYIEEENIEWHQSLPNSQVQALFGRSKAHIALSRIETYGLTVVEAQMQGCPVIAYEAGGIGENITVGLSGQFVQAKGSWKNRYLKIAELYQEVVQYDRQQIIENAKGCFDISYTAHDYEDLYEKVVAKVDNV